MPLTRLHLGVAPFLTVLFVAAKASATDVCIVQKSVDGYVALRTKPSPDGALLVRAKPGEAVVIQKTESGEQVVSARWLRVMHFPDAVAPQKSDPGYKRGRIGWMHKRYVDDCG